MEGVLDLFRGWLGPDDDNDEADTFTDDAIHATVPSEEERTQLEVDPLGGHTR